jgi:hypothetical protein
MDHLHDRSMIQQNHLKMMLLQFLHCGTSSLAQALTNGRQSSLLRSADFVQIVEHTWAKLTQSLRYPRLPHYPVTQLLIAACIILLSACETTVEIDPPDYDPELNITSNFTPDSVWAARVTKTIPIGDLGDTTSIFLDDATVMIYRDDVLVARLNHDGGEDGWYESPRMRTPRANTQYRMVVEAPGLPSASAVSMAPPPPRILTAEATKLESFDPFRGPQYLVSFSLADNPGLNYYSFSIFLAFPEDGSPISSEYTVHPAIMTHDSQQWYCFYGDVLNPIASSPAENESCTIGILSDRSFDDRTRNFDIVVNLDYDLGDELDTDLVLYVMALSPEYIEHRSSIEEHDDFDGFGQPANLYTNFEGGRGIFAGYSTQYRILDLARTE